MYDRKGKTVLKIGDFTGTNDPIVTKNDKYFYFMFSRDSLYGYKFVNLKKRTVIEYVFDDKHEGGHVEIDDNGKVSFYHIEAKVLDETVTPFKVKETETLIDTLQIK
jgi:hypothetical protein